MLWSDGWFTCHVLWLFDVFASTHAHSACETSDFNEVAPNARQTGHKNIECGCGWDRLSSMDKWITVNAMHARVPHLNSFSKSENRFDFGRCYVSILTSFRADKVTGVRWRYGMRHWIIWNGSGNAECFRQSILHRTSWPVVGNASIKRTIFWNKKLSTRIDDECTSNDAHPNLKLKILSRGRLEGKHEKKSMD